MRRVQPASRHVDIEPSRGSPQWGSALTVDGNSPVPAAQHAARSPAVAIAEGAWGR
jgi:hypothetical protein